MNTNIVEVCEYKNGIRHGRATYFSSRIIRNWMYDNDSCVPEQCTTTRAEHAFYDIEGKVVTALSDVKEPYELVQVP